MTHKTFLFLSLFYFHYEISGANSLISLCQFYSLILVVGSKKVGHWKFIGFCKIYMVDFAHKEVVFRKLLWDLARNWVFTPVEL